MSTMQEPHGTLDGLFGATDTGDQSKDAAQCFTCFSKLPPEIRLMIWELAIPARVINVWDIGRVPYTGKIPKHILSRYRYSVPPAAHACYESRQLARQTGSIRSSRMPSEDDNPLPIYWFDSCRDTLRIYNKSILKYIPRCVENITFCWRSLLLHGHGMDMNLAALPKLRHVQFEVDWRFVPSKIWDTWEFAQGREWFGGFLLNIDNETEVRRFGSRLRQYSEWQYSYWFEEIGYLRDEKLRQPKSGKEDWKITQGRLQEKWIEDHKTVVESAAGDPELESRHAKMPEFSRVLTLIPFPEDQYEDGIARYEKKNFLLFDITKKPERRCLRLRRNDSVLYLDTLIRVTGRLIPNPRISYDQRNWLRSITR